MAIAYKGRKRTTIVEPGVVGESSAAEPAEPLSVAGMLLSFMGSAGMAAGITMLYLGMGVIMATEGGFVASGGPYAIEHPAPGWVWLIPASIFAIFAAGGICFFASSRGWGFNLVMLAWSGLFIALGWNFLRFGLTALGAPINDVAWIACGIVFWVMGFGPLIMVGRALFSAVRSAAQGRRPTAAGAQGAPAQRGTGLYLLLQAIGVVAGMVAGAELFGRLTGL